MTSAPGPVHRTAIGLAILAVAGVAAYLATRPWGM